jgi:hypothetical protein
MNKPILAGFLLSNRQNGVAVENFRSMDGSDGAPNFFHPQQTANK